MADKKITALTELASGSLAATDLFQVIDDPVLTCVHEILLLIPSHKPSINW